MSAPPPGRRVAVVGAGVIGVCCARWLQRDGHAVDVFDPLGPGQGCSYGNAGVLAVDSVVPIATPGVLRALPRMLADPTGPLALRWGYLPRMLPWLLRFAWNARPARVQAGTIALAALCGRALADFRRLLEGRPAAELLLASGWLTAFESRRGLEGARRELEQRLAHGVRGEWLDGPALRERVPQLAGHVVGGIAFPDCWTCLDPADFVVRLAADIRADGGSIEPLHVTALQPVAGGVEVRTIGGSRRYDHVVVAAGAHSRTLARTVGDDFPLDTERGYHVTLPATADEGPPLPVMAGEHKFVTTSMRAGVRLAGTTELAGLARAPDPRRYTALRERARRLFPVLDTAGGTEWMGFRPTLPDSLPVIGRSPRARAVTYAFGHQHLGLTLAGVTGRLVADDLAGREPVIDPRPLRADRFRPSPRPGKRTADGGE